jgi:type II secretory pathway pseudopilin PulG
VRQAERLRGRVGWVLRVRGSFGFSLVAVLVILVTIGIVIGAMVLLASRLRQFTQTDAATSELSAVYRAIAGDQRDSFGFFGDVGAYPDSLLDLVVNPGKAGWSGPYVTDPRVANSTVLDPWGQPYELYVVDGTSGSDQLAIISRGPDGLSTNTAANPNSRSSFTGLAPTDAAYFSDPKNADNLVFPLPNAGHADALNVNTTSNLNLTISNFDANPLVNAFVPACPNLFTVTVTSVPRATNDIPATPYSPGFQASLPQGAYTILVTSAILPAPPVNERITVFPVVPVFRKHNLTGLDSSGTNQFTLTVTNKYPLDAITVLSFGTSLGTVAANGGITTFSPKACSVMTVTKSGSTVDTFTMPYADFAKIEGATAASVTLNNNFSVTVQVFDNGTFIGDVKKNKSGTFNNLSAGDTVTVVRVDTGATVSTVILTAGVNTITVP